MSQLSVKSKDDVVMKLIHYFIVQEDYKPVLLRGVEDEIWLENLEKDVKLIRINSNYLHNNAQYQQDLAKVNYIMKNIKRKTFSLKMNIVNILANTSENVEVDEVKNIETIKVNKIVDIKKNKTIIEKFPNIKEKISAKKAGPIDFFSMTEDLNEKGKNDEKKFEKIYKSKKPYVTYGLILLNVLIYGLMLIGNNNAFISNFASQAYLVRSGEVYRLLTYAFLHGSILHLFFNMYALYIIGPQIEKYYGKGKYLIIYLLSAVMGGVFSCVFSNNFSVGASGAIFGLFGSLLYFSYNFRATIDGMLRSSILPVIIVNLFLGFLIPNIDIAGHIGGLVGGFLLSMAVGINNKTKKHEKINGTIVFILLFVFMAFMLLQK
ncbi:MAG: rhomboid family intramembrane serine protease [Bacilli bacterium]